MGRLFDGAAALLGFTRAITFEGQASIWLEHLARKAANCDAYPFPINGRELDFRPLLESMIRDCLDGRPKAEIARAFHMGVAESLCSAASILCKANGIDTIVLSGGVFQNELLLEGVKWLLNGKPIFIWINSAVPPNDGGISLGQAALGAIALRGERHA
jgi:hydrogenase maturation protein HypF